ncbi:MAG: nicotinate phosphoribosyltransferase [Methylococcales bacterium]
MTHNILLNADSYKASHYLQYPPGTRYISSYIESRGGAFDQTVFFGLQMFLKEYFTKPITQADVDEAEALLSVHGVPFNRPGWERIVHEHKGLVPVEIEAVPEGTVMPTRNVLVQVRNTDPQLPWLTSYLETALLRAVWYPTTVATLSRECKKLLKRYLDETADNTQGLLFKLHDFGARGVSSAESAAIGGLAHLVNFRGSDTLACLVAANRYYSEPMAGFSIPAAEHSTITVWGRDREFDAYANMIDQFAGHKKTFAVVSDSYDLWHAIDEVWGNRLRERVEQCRGRLVVRPDSGEPVEIVNAVLRRLMDRFGHRINSKGYRVLPDYIRVIQGDGVSLAAIGEILEAMKQNAFSADNIAFGMGGELLQKINRDTLKFAMKASAAEVDGQWQDVFKDPVTDRGKRSKKGRLALVYGDGGYESVRADQLQGRKNELRTVFRDGILLIDDTLLEIRKRADVDR